MDMNINVDKVQSLLKHFGKGGVRVQTKRAKKLLVLAHGDLEKAIKLIMDDKLAMNRCPFCDSEIIGLNLDTDYVCYCDICSRGWHSPNGKVFHHMDYYSVKKVIREYDEDYEPTDYDLEEIDNNDVLKLMEGFDELCKEMGIN